MGVECVRVGNVRIGKRSGVASVRSIVKRIALMLKTGLCLLVNENAIEAAAWRRGVGGGSAKNVKRDFPKKSSANG